MLTDATELEELRKTTRDLIEEDHLPIALVRSGWERTATAGIRKIDPEPQDAVDRFFGAITGDPREIRTGAGEQLVALHVLIGLPDDDIQEGDTFTVGNRTFLVAEVHPDHSYQCKAWVVERK